MKVYLNSNVSNHSHAKNWTPHHHLLPSSAAFLFPFPELHINFEMTSLSDSDFPAMELIHAFLNFVAPPFTFFSLCLLLPPFLFFKLFLSFLRPLFAEKVAGKVVLITGASSGIGENLAYEYARRGARLSLVARRINSLREVADRAREIGSPDVTTIQADVSKVEDCKRIVEETISNFNRLDHLVNNAGVSSLCKFEDAEKITDFRHVMDINYWGSVYTTYFAAPYLRNSHGRIIVLSSSSAWLPAPRRSFYNATEAAIVSMFETLRTEFGTDIKITIVTPGYTESELTKGKFRAKQGKMEVDQDLRDVDISIFPVGSAQKCAKEIVKRACRGERYVTEPAWFKVGYWWKVFFPEIVEWGCRMMYLQRPGAPDSDAPSKKLLDLTGAKEFLYPSTIRSPEVKSE